MDVIISGSNPHVQHLRALYDKKGRKQYGQYVVEGVNIVKDLPADQPVCAYYVAAGKWDSVASLCRDSRCPVYVLDDKLLDRVAATVTPSGIIAVLPIPAADDSWRDADRLLVLDGLTDPGNVGTVVRTAVACGYRHIVMVGGIDPYSPKVVRASMGGVYRAHIHMLPQGSLLDIPHTVYALDMGGNNVFDVVPQPPFALVVGSEAQGVSQSMRARADHVVGLPMQGGMESLNAAVSCCVTMYVLNNNLGRTK